MSWKKRLIRFAKDPLALRALDQLLSRKMLGGMVIGYFIGDIAGKVLHTALGRVGGDIVGLGLSILFFAYWHIVTREVKEAEEKAKETIGKHDTEK